MHSAGTTLGKYIHNTPHGISKYKYTSSVLFLILILIEIEFTEGSWDECMKGEFQLPFIF